MMPQNSVGRDASKRTAKFPQTRFVKGVMIWLAELAIFGMILACLIVKGPAWFGLILAFGAVVALAYAKPSLFGQRVGFALRKGRSSSLRNGAALMQGNRVFTYTGIAVLVIAYPLLGFSNAYLIHVGAMAGICVILALGLNMTLGTAGLLDLGYAASYAIGAYVYALTTVHYGLAFSIALPIAATGSALFGLAVGLAVSRLKGHYIGLVTLAIGAIVYILLVNLPGLTGGTDGISHIHAPEAFGHSFRTTLTVLGRTYPNTVNFYYLVAAFVLLAIIGAEHLDNSRVGRAWAALREDEAAAECSGVDVRKYRLLAFVTASFYAGVAGSLFASMIGYVNPDNFTFSQSLLFVLMVLLGGSGSVRGAILGAIALTIIPERLREFESFRLPLLGVVVLLLMLFRRQGILPRRIRVRAVPTQSSTSADQET